MADIPDQPVMRCVENVMNGGGAFDHAKAGAQMPARHAHRCNHFLSQLVPHLPPLAALQLAQVGSRMYLIKPGGDERWPFGPSSRSDRKRDGWGTSVSVGGNRGGGRKIKK